MSKRAQDKYNHKCQGIDESVSFLCLVREWPDGVFSVVRLISGKRELIPVEWLIRGVSEAEARAVLEQAK